jgi:predicted outer membrane repeat protein
VINHNDAVNGGGIAVGDNGTGSAVVRLFPSDDSNPTKLDDNSAAGNGGAIYAEGASDVCLFAPSLHRNLATEGAAIYKRDGGGIYLNAGIPSRLGAECGPETVAALGGATGCAYGGDCNVFAYNKTEDSGSNPTDGAILFHYNAELIGSRFRLQHNSSAQVITANSGGTIISRCLVTDNDIREAAILSYYWGGGTTQIGECTIANNTMYTGGHVLDMEVISQVSIGSLIIAEPGIPSLRFIPLYSGEQPQAHYIISGEVATFPSDPTLMAMANPYVNFVDPEDGDYHLTVTAPALDYAPVHADASLDCSSGIYDLPNVTNRFGAQDLGAYELPPPDRIFASGFGDAIAPLIGCDTNATGGE